MLILLAPSSACFQYRAAPPAELAVGSYTAVALSDSGAQLLAPAVGPRAVRLQGRLVQAERSALTVSVSSIVRSPSQEESWPSEWVRVPLSAVQQVQVRRLDRPRSALLASAVLVGILTTRLVIDANSGSGGTSGAGGAVAQ